jgi:hypothetical protein
MAAKPPRTPAAEVGYDAFKLWLALDCLKYIRQERACKRKSPYKPVGDDYNVTFNEWRIWASASSNMALARPFGGEAEYVCAVRRHLL